MNPSETVPFSEHRLAGLRKLVARGEGGSLEFKRKATHPDKIVRELIAFANSSGGTLLIGVDDNGTIPGLSYPDEDFLAVDQALRKYCHPPLSINPFIIPVSAVKFVVQLEVEVNEHRPHFFRAGDGARESFVRAGDMSVKASREMLEIVRRSKKEKNIQFTFGDAERMLMQYLEEKKSISLSEFRALARLNRFQATRKLVLLVLANVLAIHPGEKGDRYSRR